MEYNRKIIYLAGFLFSLPIALASYINSSFISSFVGEKYVGIMYVLGSIGSVLALLAAPQIFRKIGGYRFLLIMILLDALSLLVLSFTENIWGIALMFILGFSMNTLIFFSLDEILKIFSSDSSTGAIRGVYAALSSFAWVVAQLASGIFFGGISFQSIYFASFLVMMLFFLVSFFKLKSIPDPNYDQIDLSTSVKNFFKNKELSRAYIISFLLQFFYCWMIIYTPIYLHNYIGFSWKEIGVIFAIMLLPFLIIPFPLGRRSDKIGERIMLMVGFIIASCATLLLFFIQQREVWVWALLLFSTRIGASTIEVMNDSYFFKHIKPENEELVGFYRTAPPVAYIIGPIVASGLFIFIPSFNFLYLVLGAVMLFGIYLASTISKEDI